MDNQDSQANPKKLFIGNLPYTTTQDQLTEMFSPHGEIVELNLISDRFSGRSKGIAFVEYTTEEAAQAAIEALHESEIDGRKIIVNVARPKQPRENRSFDGDRRGGGGFGNRGGGGRY